MPKPNVHLEEHYGWHAMRKDEHDFSDCFSEQYHHVPQKLLRRLERAWDEVYKIEDEIDALKTWRAE